MRKKPLLYHLYDLISIVTDKIYNLYIFRANRVICGEKITIHGKVWIKGEKGRIILGNGVLINSGYRNNPIGGEERVTFWIRGNGKIVIGNNVGISNSAFVCEKEIMIESNVLIGGGTRIYDTDFHSLKLKERLKYIDDRDIHCEKVTIKEGAFIGANVMILKGVTIGRESIIGAGSVVTRTVPDYEIWAGNPAKFIRKIYD